jgi:hypothetical protein
VSRRRDRLGPLEREASREDRQPPQRATLVVVEERIRPVERRAERSMPRGRIASAVDVE